MTPDLIVGIALGCLAIPPLAIMLYLARLEKDPKRQLEKEIEAIARDFENLVRRTNETKWRIRDLEKNKKEFEERGEGQAANIVSIMLRAEERKSSEQLVEYRIMDDRVKALVELQKELMAQK